jgi:hypothetical protein
MSLHRRRLRKRGPNLAQVDFGRGQNAASDGRFPGESLSYPELKQRFGQLLPVEVSRSTWRWPVTLIAIVGVTALLYALLSRI